MKRLFLIAASLCAAGGMVLAAGGQAAPQSVKDGVYTTAQATAGQAAYAEKCASCHGAMTSTAPDMAPLLHDYVFQDTWKTRTVGELFDRIRNTMPQNEPGTMTPQRTAEIVAYILSANHFPAGAVPLAEDVDALNRIKMDVEP